MTKSVFSLSLFFFFLALCSTFSEKLAAQGKTADPRLNRIRNSTFSKSIFLFDDQPIDGGTNNRALNDGDLPIKANDTVKVKMMCIDKAVHLYFCSMRQIQTIPPQRRPTQ